MTIPPELESKILCYFHAEKWRVGTISTLLNVHHSAVSRVLTKTGLPPMGAVRCASVIDPYLPFIRETLKKFSTLNASRLYVMITERDNPDRPSQSRHMVSLHRSKQKAEAYLRLRTLPSEQGQVDWAHFGHIEIGRARRPLMGLVMVLSWSRQMSEPLKHGVGFQEPCSTIT